MADRKHIEASKIDALYSWLSYDLQKMKAELMNELKYSSVQFGSLYSEMKTDKEKSAQAISQEIRYSYKQNQTIYDDLARMLSGEVSERIKLTEELNGRMDALSEVIASLEKIQATVKDINTVTADEVSETVHDALADSLPSLQSSIDEVKYGYLQQQSIYDGLRTILEDDVLSKLSLVEEKLVALDEIKEQVLECIARIENIDFKSVVEVVCEKIEESVTEHNRQVLDAINAIPVAENVDYTRIADEVGDKVLEIISDVVPQAQATVVEATVDYDKIVYGTAEKVVESMPQPEKIDYARIEASLAAAVDRAVEQAVAKVAAIDYDLLSDMVVAKLAKQQATVTEESVDAIADKVLAKVGAVEVIDYDRVAAIVDEKLSQGEDESTYELILDDDGIDAIAENVAQRLSAMCEVEEVIEEVIEEVPVEEVVEETPVEETVVEEVVEEAPVEETVVEEVVEETPVEETVVEEVVEETPVEEAPVEETVAEEVVEEVVEETPVEEAPVEETPVTEELAVSDELNFDELNDQLVDAETGLVIRLKKSFTAKIRQSEEKVKGYYSDIKNELTSYNKINSNVSWHGDRFNFGRDTVAKVNICGKTLCLYLALDPEDPELKTTVYHQKNVGHQKAYESTPFMVKVKSDAAAKKALRLVGTLAEKLGTEKEADFVPVDYVEELAYASTKELFQEGFIKVTKEKKVDLDF